MDSNFFDDKRQQKALKWLEEKWPKAKRQCEICGNEHWTLAGDLITPLAFSAGNINLGGNSYPSVLLLCSSCGNSKVFNAVIMKILEV